MVKAYTTRTFQRWARKSGVDDRCLWQAVLEMERGLVDAELGAGLVKKRLPLPGQGKRGGARVIVATRWQGVWFFLLGYNKNKADNITEASLQSLQLLGARLLDLPADEFSQALAIGSIKEVTHEGN